MPRVIITKLPLTSIFDPVQDIALNLQYTDPATNSPVTQLTQSLYVQRIGSAVSVLMGQMTDAGNAITSIQDTLNGLSIPSAYQPPVIVASGVMGDNASHAFQDVVAATASQFADLRNVSGTVDKINTAISRQTAGLATLPALSQPGTMGAITGWINAPGTLAESHGNQWLTISDIRAAVATLQQQVAIGCRDLIIDFMAVLSNNGQTATLYFEGYTFLPSGFTDTDVQGSLLTIRDVDGNSFSRHIKIPEASTGAPIVIDLIPSGLLPTSDYTFQLQAALTNETLTCEKTIIKSVTNNANVCPVLGLTASATSIAIAFTPPIINNISYRLDLLDDTANSIIATQTFTPVSTAIITYTFNNLTPATTYKFRMTTTVNSLPPVICPLATKETIAQ